MNRGSKAGKSKDASTSTNRDAVTQEMRNAYRVVLREKEQIVEDIRSAHNEIKQAAISLDQLKAELTRVTSARIDRIDDFSSVNAPKVITPPRLSPERFQSPPSTPTHSIEEEPPPTSSPPQAKKIQPVAVTTSKGTSPPKVVEEEKFSKGTSTPVQPKKVHVPTTETGTTVAAPPPVVASKGTSPAPVKTMFEGEKTMPKRGQPCPKEQKYSQSDTVPKRREVVVPSGDSHPVKKPKEVIYQKRLVQMIQEEDDDEDLEDALIVQRQLHMQIAGMHAAIQQRVCIAGAFISLLVFLILFY